MLVIIPIESFHLVESEMNRQGLQREHICWQARFAATQLRACSSSSTHRVSPSASRSSIRPWPPATRGPARLRDGRAADTRGAAPTPRESMVRLGARSPRAPRVRCHGRCRGAGRAHGALRDGRQPAGRVEVDVHAKLRPTRVTREQIIKSVDDSLERLGLGFVDLYLVQ